MTESAEDSISSISEGWMSSTALTLTGKGKFLSMLFILTLMSCTKHVPSTSSVPLSISPTVSVPTNVLPTSTLSVEPTPTATLFATPTMLPVIRLENAAQVTELARYVRYEVRDDVWPMYRAIDDVAFAPEGYLLAFASCDGAGLWNVENYLTQSSVTESRPISISQEYASSVAFTHNGSRLIIGSFRDSGVQIWNINTKKLRHLNLQIGSVTDISFTYDGNVMGVSGRGGIRTLDGKTLYGSPARIFDGPSPNILYFTTCVAFSSDGQLVAAGSNNFELSHNSIPSQSIFLWDLNTGEIVNEFGNDQSLPEISSVVFSRDGSTLISSDWAGKIRFWDVISGDLVRTIESDTEITHRVILSSDGRMLVTSNQDGTIKFWDIETAQLIHTIQAHTVRVSSIAFSFDGRVIASSSWDGTVALWGIK